MTFNIDDTNIIFSISNYTSKFPDEWCNVTIDVSNKNFNYHNNGELLMNQEIEFIVKSLKKLLNDEFKEKEDIEFIEPNLSLVLYPKYNLKDNKNCIYVKKGCEIVDISMDFEIHLQNKEGVYTDQKYVMGFYKREIQLLLNYLEKVIK